MAIELRTRSEDNYDEDARLDKSLHMLMDWDVLSYRHVWFRLCVFLDHGSQQIVSFQTSNFYQLKNHLIHFTGFLLPFMCPITFLTSYVYHAWPSQRLYHLIYLIKLNLLTGINLLINLHGLNFLSYMLLVHVSGIAVLIYLLISLPGYFKTVYWCSGYNGTHAETSQEHPSRITWCINCITFLDV